MKIDIKDGKDLKRGQWAYCTDNPYNPQKESFRWISVSDLMSLKNILENFKYHTMKEIEDIIGYGQDVFEIRDRANALVEIEDGLNMIDGCLHPEGAEKAEDEEGPDTSDPLEKFNEELKWKQKLSSENPSDGTCINSSENKEEVINAIKNIIDKLYQDNDKLKAEELFLNPELVKEYQAYMARNVFTNTDGDKDGN